MSAAAERVVLRWIHLIFSVPIIGYIYSPFEDIHYYAHSVRFVFVPVLLLSGLWMWKGRFLLRLVSRRPA